MPFDITTVVKYVSILLIVLVFAGGGTYLNSQAKNLAKSQEQIAHLQEQLKASQQALEVFQKISDADTATVIKLRDQNKAMEEQLNILINEISKIEDKKVSSPVLRSTIKKLQEMSNE